MPWSSFPMPPQRAVFLGFYALAALLAGTEVVILGLALNPRVHPDYRAFYIDETTTCLNRDRIGSYSLGETISFLHLGKQRDRMKRADGMKVCGWTGADRRRHAFPGRDLAAPRENPGSRRRPGRHAGNDPNGSPAADYSEGAHISERRSRA
ncbi:hypothetical protein [Mesorhizobium sp. WSM2239]|uniref:Uncharacterized protein n=2 Tax=unclassified Mesorhizobium TaxID=325217 RepID=A0AAU8DH36_9HYPH